MIANSRAQHRLRLVGRFAGVLLVLAGSSVARQSNDAPNPTKDAHGSYLVPNVAPWSSIDTKQTIEIMHQLRKTQAYESQELPQKIVDLGRLYAPLYSLRLLSCSIGRDMLTMQYFGSTRAGCAPRWMRPFALTKLLVGPSASLSG